MDESPESDSTEDELHKQALSRARDSALRLLARREHSVLELQHKLQQREFEGEVIDAVLQRLTESDLQSDERFAERYIESRVARRYGPNRIRGELVRKGVSGSLAEQALGSAEVNWVEVAAEALSRLKGDPADFEDRAKLTRKLYLRGFPQEIITKVLSQRG